MPPTFPDGLDAEIMTFACLEQAWQEASLPSQREHVTPFIYQHPERFRCEALRNEPDLSHLRWTVDEPADFEFVTRVYEALHPQNPAFGMHDVLAFLAEHEGVAQLNGHFERNAGYYKSLAKDRAAQSEQC
jgi:spore coat polysaccharide biosynthesis protein SpsF